MMFNSFSVVVLLGSFTFLIMGCSTDLVCEGKGETIHSCTWWVPNPQQNECGCTHTLEKHHDLFCAAGMEGARTQIEEKGAVPQSIICEDTGQSTLHLEGDDGAGGAPGIKPQTDPDSSAGSGPDPSTGSGAGLGGPPSNCVSVCAQ